MEETAIVKVDVNGQEAEDKMRELIDLTKHWKKALEEAMRIKDPKAIKEADKNLKLATKATKELEKQMFDVNKVMKNLSGASLHDLKKAQRELNKELSSPALKRNSKEWNALTGKLRRVKGELTKVRKEMYTTARGANKVKIGLQNIGAALGIAGGVYMLINAFKNFINISMNFEKALSSLSAITGATGADLDYLKQQAIALSKQTLQSATDIVRAYELIGSQRPELLKNTKALAEVTKQAVILSEATGGKLGLVDAAKSVTTVMNQMAQSVDQAGRITNIMAAGSKVGSANVLYLSEVYEKAGTSAMLMKISVEQLAGATEAIAPFFSEATTAGNSFDKVLLKLKEKQIGYTDGVFNLNDAIDELRMRYNAGETAAQIFGMEHAKLGELLVLNQDKMNMYTKAVTGTAVALEQQKVQNNNLDGALTQLGNSVDTFMIKLNSSNKSLAENIRFITALVNSYDDIDAVFSKKGIIEGMLTFKETLKEINDEKAKEDAKFFDSDGIVKDSAVAKRSIEELDVELQKITGDASIYFENWKNKTGDEKAFWAGQYDIAQQNIGLINIAVAAKKNLLSAEDKVETPEEKATRLAKEAAVKQAEIAKTTKALFMSDIETKLEALKKEENELRKKGIAEVDIARWVAQEKKNIYESVQKTHKAFDPTKLKAALEYEDEYLKMKAETLKKYREEDLQDIIDAFELKTTVRETEHQKGLAALGNNEEARANLDKEFKKEEAMRQLAHLEGLTEMLNTQLIEGGIDGLSIEDAMLSEEEKEALTSRITDLQLLIAQLQDEIAGETTGDSVGGVIAKYLLGEDWDKMDLGDKIQAIGDISIKTLKDINTIISNNENQQLMDFKNITAKKKELLNKQLNDGIISYDEYTARTAQLDEELDKKKRKIDHDQAVRGKRLAILQIVVSTAAGVARAFKDYAWPFSLIPAGIIAALGAFQIGVADSEPVPALATGRYPVTAQDGNTYNARMYGKPTTTEIIKGPALVSEIEDEMIIDGPTTRNLVFNYPDIVEGIKQLSMGGTPQFAEGRYPASATTDTVSDDATTNTTQTEAMELLTQAVNRLVDEGVIANLIADEDYYRTHQEGEKEYDDFQALVN